VKQSYFISFLLLVLLQVVLFNHLHLFGAINPMLYLLFFVFYRFESDQTLLIAFSFLLGFSTLTTGFLRPLLIRNAFGITVETPQSFFSDSRILNKVFFLILLVFVHHLLYFILAYFSWESLILILKNTFLTLIFSLLLMGVTLSFYPSKK
jgi:hypothetical protein